MEEENTTDSVIIAATNYPELLDYALGRRFDDVIVYGFPDTRRRSRLSNSRLGTFRPSR